MTTSLASAMLRPAADATSAVLPPSIRSGMPRTRPTSFPRGATASYSPWLPDLACVSCATASMAIVLTAWSVLP